MDPEQDSCAKRRLNYLNKSDNYDFNDKKRFRRDHFASNFIPTATEGR